MSRKSIINLATVVSPLLAFGLVLPPVAIAAPEGPVASETLITSQSPPPPTTQVQQQGDLSQAQDPNLQKQQQQTFGAAPNNQTYQGPGITMQPQIQVQVQPQIQITAHPHAEANPTTNSNSTSSGTSTATATADNDIKADSNSQAQSQSQSDADSKVVAPVAAAPAPVRTVPTTIRVKTRVVPGTYAPVHPIYPYKPPKRRKGLMIAGWTIFGASYIPTAFTGASIYDYCTHNRTGADRQSCREIGQLLMIPAVGPFMAMNNVESATESYYLALTGAVQTAGLLMAIIGTSQYIRDGKRNERLSQHGVRVAKGLHIGAGSMTYQF